MTRFRLVVLAEESSGRAPQPSSVLNSSFAYAWLHARYSARNRAILRRIRWSVGSPDAMSAMNSCGLFTFSSAPRSSGASRRPSSSRYVPRNRSSNGRHMFSMMHIVSILL
uniref:Uncharacterized protein n=1 Tax=Anopheles melas TaxID=34690 RepID=A0A182TNV8_9DIPT